MILFVSSGKGPPLLLHISLENFKSFRHPVAIRLRAGATTRLKGNLFELSNGTRYLKSIALYGKNASGKTNILDALYALKTFATFSSEDRKPTASIPLFEPFALSRNTTNLPALIAITIYIDGSLYSYEVSATSERVWSERLTQTRVAKRRSRKPESTHSLIQRHWSEETQKYEIELSPELGPPSMREAGASQTPPNRLILGKLAALNSDIATQLLAWFDEDLDFYDMHRNREAEDAMLQSAAKLFQEDPQFAALLSRYLADADTGIERLTTNLEKRFGPMFIAEEKRFELKEQLLPELSFHHTTADGSEVVFRKHRESSGTRRFVAMLAAIFRPCQRTKVVCVDELSASLHPDLVATLVQLVHSRTTNPGHTQLIFTTHDTHLMDPERLLRRDQIVLCEKSTTGESTAFRLDEFQDNARSDANLQKQYLQNRFGGKPQFGPLLEDVPVDENPYEVTH